MNKFDDAIASLMKAKEIDPNNPEVYSNLGKLDLVKSVKIALQHYIYSIMYYLYALQMQF